jgi:glucokinase
VKRAALVNGVPASGKSTVARGLADRLGWPLLRLDTVKEPFFDALGIGDRAFNRKLGRASSAAIWSIVADGPPGMGVVVDAWFGFEPRELLDDHLRRAGVARTAEVWCHAPAEELARRYAARLDQRHPGHPGAAFIPELIDLAKRAAPLARGPVLDVDTMRPLDIEPILDWLREALALEAPP